MQLETTLKIYETEKERRRNGARPIAILFWEIDFMACFTVSTERTILGRYPIVIEQQPDLSLSEVQMLPIYNGKAYNLRAAYE